jgi:ribose transport system ATP-binding protein
MTGVCKTFGPVRALNNVHLDVGRGEVHALIGENGAGKSVLMKILAGTYRPDRGNLEFDGAPLEAHSPKEARRRGITMIHQELTIAPHLSVADNVTLGIEQTRLGVVRNRDGVVREILESLGHGDLNLAAKAGGLGVGLQQVVEIARALLTQAKLVIMDEPTSSLSKADTEVLFRTIGKLKAGGVTVIYISHFLEEIARIADRYTVLRDGESVAAGEMGGTPLAQIIRHMVGRSLTEMFPRAEHAVGEPVCAVRGLQKPPRVADVSFELHRGEILGIAGLVGSGRTETLRCLLGLDRAQRGEVSFADGKPFPCSAMTPKVALERGFSLLSEDRKEEGLVVELTIKDNLTLSSLRRFVFPGTRAVLDLRKEAAAAREKAQTLGIRCKSILQKTADLSGGNQQKVAFGRMLTTGSRILLLDEPTRGIDVGSKVEIYRLIGALAAQGNAVVMVSSQIPELLGICDTLAVMHRGILSPVGPVGSWDEESVMEWATTGKRRNP